MLYIRRHTFENDNGKGFNISFMDWAEFKPMVISGTRDLKGWSHLTEYDCIIGGIDFDMGYL